MRKPIPTIGIRGGGALKRTVAVLLALFVLGLLAGGCSALYVLQIPSYHLHLEETLAMAEKTGKDKEMPYEYWKAKFHYGNSVNQYERGSMEESYRQGGIAIGFAEKLIK